MRPKLVVYSQELSGCPCFESVFNTEFHAEAADTAKRFVSKMKRFNPDAAVVCFCSAHEKDAEKLLQLDALSGPLPVLACSKTLSPDFIAAVAQQGVNRFLCCEWDKTKIATTIFEAIRRGAIKEFLETAHPGRLARSPHLRKMVDEIVHVFPNRLTEKELAQGLGISRSWLQKLCRSAFNSSFHRLLRRLWVYQALRLMQYTNLDNTEIALQLNYSEESSMARDFRKELHCSPKDARKILTSHTPKELLR
jgi:AraC-like DNA-binding protein